MLKRVKPVRSYHGIAFSTTDTNRKYLAKDFSHRCAYCDDLENISRRRFEVEHFAPKSKFPHLEFDYDNLLYACPWCNRAKWDTWPSDRSNVNVVGDEGFIDPCDDEYCRHLDRDGSGKIIWKTQLGKYMYNTLKLYLKIHEINYNIERLYEARGRLQVDINREQVEGKVSTEKKSLLLELDEKFFSYFNLWMEI